MTSNPDAMPSTCTIVGSTAPPHTDVFGLSADARFAAVSAPSVAAQQLPQLQPTASKSPRSSHGTDLMSPHVCVPHGLAQSSAAAAELISIT